MLEIHGFSRCPFAFRTRIVATEKGVAFDWLPCDVAELDPRTAAHNPSKRSPLIWQDGFSITESAIIAQYIDEAFPGPALQHTDPRERARMRLAIVELGALKFDGRRELTDDERAKVEAALGKLDDKLAAGAPWLGGNAPDFADFEHWPWLVLLDRKGMLAAFPRVAAYWQRVAERPSFSATNPYRG